MSPQFDQNRALAYFRSATVRSLRNDIVRIWLGASNEHDVCLVWLIIWEQKYLLPSKDMQKELREVRYPYELV